MVATSKICDSFVFDDLNNPPYENITFIDTMLYQPVYTLPPSDQHDVDPAWFERRRKCHETNPLLRSWLDEEVDALRAFHDGHTTASEAATAITRPICTTSPLPEFVNYNDRVAVQYLWYLLGAALIEWPAVRTPDLFALLDAIAKVPDPIHRGEVTDINGKPMTWDKYPDLNWCLPYVGEPGEFCLQRPKDAPWSETRGLKECPDEATLAAARQVYLRFQDLKAQLFVKGIMRVFLSEIYEIIQALETELVDVDGRLTPVERGAGLQVRLDWSLPAISFMLRDNADEIYRLIVQEGHGGKQYIWPCMPDGAGKFRGTQRWSFWKRRLGELIEGNVDEEVKAAAQATLSSMEAVHPCQ